ncbi:MULTISPECIES: hypothetical protein [Chryseobacterium]|uniref:Uncharacterized protein n=2 Tax=Chryseobacterium cucumeris TaxID=1813611 RepID=A0ABX9X465_9FLAO|nr:MULTISPECIES: hypothetical protein [Chryseobacterium]MDH5032344.1 hypothetical protein [Chryseobacterium cucumeris]QWT85994.1 hypothetical protein KBP46_21585 [Chryseobacterium sp. PCH239]ROH90605.1 hypothetical protein EGI15_18270 [Chryseobacterium cucumeris]
MKFLILFPIVLSLLANPEEIVSKELSCKDFKNGKFVLINKKTNKRYLIEKSKDLQKEQVFDLTINKKIQKDRYYKILWKSDCQFILLLDLAKNQYDETDKYINSNGGYLCTIKKIEGKCAIIETQFEGEVFASEVCKTQ